MIPVTNISKRAGEEIVQLYVRKPDDPDGPVKTLRGFRRVNIPAGKTVEVRMPLTDETFNWWDVAAWDVKPVRGDYVLLYGGSSADASLKSLIILLIRIVLLINHKKPSQLLVGFIFPKATKGLLKRLC